MSRIIYGQPYVMEDTLYQEQTTVDNGKMTNDTVALKENIWEDLLDSEGTYQTNSKKDYFFWDITVTSIEDENITIKFECPKPKQEVIIKLREDYDPEEEALETYSGDYALYWAKKAYESAKNYENNAVIQRKEITFAGGEVVDYSTGECVKRNTYTVTNNDSGLGDLTNLLSLF